MNLYLDDNIASRQLASLLAKAGHVVVMPADAGLDSAKDVTHFTHAIREQLVCLTRDHDDYRALHRLVLAAGGHHPGIIAVRYDNDKSRDMKPRHIVSALERMSKAGIPINDDFHVLNDWR